MIRFSKYIWLYFFISALVLVPGTYSLIRFGLKPAIDFTGGTLVEVRSASGTTSTFRFKPGEPLPATFSGQIVRNEEIGPLLGKELLGKTVMAAILAVIMILSYVAWAFRNIRYGVSAIIALIHDLLVVVGIFSLLGKFAGVEVDTLFVTAFLTTMSFSVHDTIVVFHRIRELSRKGARGSFEDLADTALTETMNRSLTNSYTIIFMLLALVLLGGETVRWFVVALLIGTISGTYSSPFVATPVLILWHRLRQRR